MSARRFGIVPVGTNVADHIRMRNIAIPAGRVTLAGMLGLPERAVGAVVFAHGSGSGRFSPRNTSVAATLQRAGLATLLVDLLTEEEAENRRLVFDIDLLADRLRGCTAWLAQDPATGALPVGYFGASTGAGAALVAAADAGSSVRAVVSRGGRPDLAGGALSRVQAPTLLIVGGADIPVIPLNESALAQLRCTKKLVIVPGATHLFEEPGALEQVADLARDWFLQYLPVEQSGRASGI
jgi:putative phosphoribosyl transferase